MKAWMGSAVPEKNPKLPILISYHYLRAMNKEKIESILSNKNIELLVDSGAFSALNSGKEILLEEYIEFAKEYKDRLFGYFLLDKLGDIKVTTKNLEKMLSEGLKPIPIHIRGADQKTMDDLFKISNYVGLGGFRRPQRGASGKDYVKQKMIWANNRNVHWLGYTNKDMVYGFKPFSVDCSSWNACLLYGELSLYHGNGVWGRKFNFKDCRNGLVTKQDMYVIERCGFQVSDLKQEKHWRGSKEDALRSDQTATFNCNAYSWAKYSLEIRKIVGTRVFIAIAQFSQLQSFLNVYQTMFLKS